jgi:hypothetical protein
MRLERVTTGLLAFSMVVAVFGAGLAFLLKNALDERRSGSGAARRSERAAVGEPALAAGDRVGQPVTRQRGEPLIHGSRAEPRDGAGASAGRAADSTPEQPVGRVQPDLPSHMPAQPKAPEIRPAKRGRDATVEDLWQQEERILAAILQSLEGVNNQAAAQKARAGLEPLFVELFRVRERLDEAALMKKEKALTPPEHQHRFIIATKISMEMGRLSASGIANIQLLLDEYARLNRRFLAIAASEPSDLVHSFLGYSITYTRHLRFRFQEERLIIFELFAQVAARIQSPEDLRARTADLRNLSKQADVLDGWEKLVGPAPEAISRMVRADPGLSPRAASAQRQIQRELVRIESDVRDGKEIIKTLKKECPFIQQR